MAIGSFAVGVDVGGTNMRAARIAPDGAILDKAAVNGSRDPEKALELIRGLIGDMGGSQAVGIGVGVPGRVDGRTGEVFSGGFLNLAGADLKSDLSRFFGRPVQISNDCGMALIAESRKGAGRGLRNIAMMTIGTGIGGAVMENGQLLTGRRCAGQLGHLIVNLNGQRCPCGQVGCVETESSGTSLKRHLAEAGYPPDTRFEQLISQARAGDSGAQEIMRAWSGPLRAAIRTLSAAVDPEIVILGGGMGHAALQALEFLPANPSWYEVEVRAAELADDAGVIGSGLSAFDLVGGDSASHAAAGKRLIMVNGVPASGKSSLARELGLLTGWPIIGLDTIKNPFLELIEGVDRSFNRVLGRASYKAIFSIIKESAPGSTFIVDAWFGFQSLDILKDSLAMAGISDVAELWCHAPAEVVGERYEKRIDQRPPGHPGLSYVPELVSLARRAEPCRLGPVLDVDTTLPWDVDAVARWARQALGGV